MKKIALFTILFIILSNYIIGQDLEKYNAFVKEASNLYDEKKYSESAEKYKEAFDQLDGKAYSIHRYNAACAYSLANNVEKAFYHLFYLAEKPKNKYKDVDQITADKDFITLHDDERWEKLIELIKKNKEEYEKHLDKPLIAILDTIYEEDQKYRQQIDSIQKKFGWESEEMNRHWKLISENDSINLIRVKKILDERGWLGSEVIGNRGNTTLFLVIQHADLETQKKYLPMMREAVENGNARAYSLALLEDRVALGQGKKQIYGSQIGRDEETGDYYVLPLIEPEKVNERRSEVGLGTIEDYVSRWKISWDSEEYKKNLPKYELKQKH